MTISPLLRALAAAAALVLSAPAWSAGGGAVPATGRQPIRRGCRRGDPDPGRAGPVQGGTGHPAAAGPAAARSRRTCSSSSAWRQPAHRSSPVLPTMRTGRPPRRGHRLAARHAGQTAPIWCAIRLELARAFFLKGENNLARKHFEHVLAGSPPGAVAANVRRFLSEIRARRRWSLRAGFALAPDTNIGGTSAERIIYINNLPFTPRPGGADDVGHRRLGMGRLGIPASAQRASSPAHRGRRLAA